CYFFNIRPSTEFSVLSLHDALPHTVDHSSWESSSPPKYCARTSCLRPSGPSRHPSCTYTNRGCQRPPCCLGTWSSSASTNTYFTRRFVPGALRSSGTRVCLRAAITVCADTCHASSCAHRPLLRYDCSTARSTSRAFTPSLTRWWGVTPMTASARYAYCFLARWRKYVRS